MFNVLVLDYHISSSFCLALFTELIARNVATEVYIIRQINLINKIYNDNTMTTITNNLHPQIFRRRSSIKSSSSSSRIG